MLPLLSMIVRLRFTAFRFLFNNNDFAEAASLKPSTFSDISLKKETDNSSIRKRPLPILLYNHFKQTTPSFLDRVIRAGRKAKGSIANACGMLFGFHYSRLG